MTNRKSFSKALIVEGGAMRGVFSTGVLDGFLEAGFNPFDLCVGVSSGAGNLAAYLAQMPGRNLRIYTDYSLRPEFIRLRRLARGGHLMDLDWLWKITIAEIRLDLATIYAGTGLFLVGLTDVETGKAVYQETNAANLEPVLKASSAMPILYRGFPSIAGRPTADGGLADPLPVAVALERGARRIMVIRSRSASYIKHENLSQALLQWQLKPYPDLCRTIAGRVGRYNQAVALIRNPPAGVAIHEVCPPEKFRPARLGRNKAVLVEGYRQGQRAAIGAIRAWLRDDC
jgi:predicted patatin/cPLA2 family phospholipase